jgi:predicted site-specific integrase-resolvase
MNPFTMVVCIVLIVAVSRVFRARYHAQGSLSAPADTADTLRLRDEVRQMKERIQVLERVITDNHKSVDLDREIERLRDR